MSQCFYMCLYNPFIELNWEARSPMLDDTEKLFRQSPSYFTNQDTHIYMQQQLVTFKALKQAFCLH